MATVTTINQTDAISDSRSTINTNFTNLNTDKIENVNSGTGTDISGILKGNGSAVIVATSGDADSIVSSASTTTAGKIEIATSAEINTGTDATRAVSPDGLAGSNIGIRYIQAVVFDFTTNTAAGDGKFYFHIPAGLTGMNLVEVHAEVVTAGTTGTTDIQIANVTQAADMLSTKLTIDSGETGSDTAATPAVIDTANDDVATNDVLRIDVDAVSTTPAQGLILTMGFQLP